MTRDSPDVGEHLHQHLLAQLAVADLLPARPTALNGESAPPTSESTVDGHHPDADKRKTGLIALVTIPLATASAPGTTRVQPQHVPADTRVTIKAGAARAQGNVTLHPQAGPMHSAESTRTRTAASSGHPPAATPIAPGPAPPSSARIAVSTAPHDTRLLATFATTKAKVPVDARSISTDAPASGGFTLATFAGTLNHAGGTTAAGAATTVTTTLAPTLQAPIGSAAWQQQLGSQLARLAKRGQQKIELHVHPRELGPLQISLQLSQGGAQAHFLAAHAQVRDAVQQAIPQLREALANQGIALGEAMVGQQQQQAGQQSMWASSMQSSSAFGNGHGELEAVSAVHAPRTVQVVLHGHGVDLYA
ncbi:MAG TPA: flagellar hook-length control protein FliK [Oleiagrimonas sp.]|nr:flagellar hook-length control protein FliK [Oleiagrimonas sp.]